ncbi:putative phytanoyl- dioxygenase family protein [Diplodia seriata]|uniref:Putative phytanoyl-dioxygenase family protein n=1 Tax=Diplodia seriata TaxID=420778 RepID=A0A0G2DTB1_9PEZI|nr:putative phytanoyl- dioxygenase family protein [Diplodia seriata]
MIPSTNEYVSVLYGALATVIQASESYSKVMDVLPKAMIDINDAVSAIEKRLWLFDNDNMKSYAWRMYSQIFSFLGDIIRWTPIYDHKQTRR